MTAITSQTNNLRPEKTKHPKRKTKLIIIAALIISIPLFVTYLANASRLPEAINMSSTMGTHGMDMPAPTSIESLRLGQTDAPLKTYTLTAEVIKRQGLPDQWGFNGTVPGPELRVHQGDHIRVTLINHLPVSTSIHWHGISVPNVADGVAGVTQDSVQPQASYIYDFIATEPGTYWYHSHQDTSNQIPRGLLGALIVEPDTLPHYDHDYTLMYHDLQPLTREFFPILRKILGEVDKKAILINGATTDIQLNAQPGQLIRLRLINGTAGEQKAYGNPLRLVLAGVSFKIVALDGHDINEPQEINVQVLPIGSGQRYDLVFRMPEAGVVQLVGEDQTTGVSIGQGQLAKPDFTQLPIFDLTSYGKPVSDAIAARSSFDQTQDILLGNRPGFHDGKFGLSHTINSQEFPNVPMITVRPNQVVKLHIVNNTEEYHPMHLHGHFFTVLAKNNVALTGSPIHLDTLTLAPGETWDVAFIADNPGLWMLHCHVLIHAATGMDMMVIYPNISTPYTVGTKSGNVPE
jgi:FtsP/CotA-like multicopper oxidase with cupredoxin domain